ncbi:hypothetical protein V8C37DRAFT_304688 [Trichoderma ceciliae]
MPRAGYDLTGTAPGSPASEAASRARQRTAPGNRTPRAGTPANPFHPEEDEQETPRASRMGIPAGIARADPPTYSQMNFALQNPQGFQIQRRLPRQELYQNPLNISSIQVASHSMARLTNARYGHGVSLEAHSSIFRGNATPTSTGHGFELVNAPTPFGTANFRTADFGAQQQQQLWSNSQFHALPANQLGFQSRHSVYPDPESFVHSHATAGTARHPALGSASARTLGSQTTGEDAEMTGVNN